MYEFRLENRRIQKKMQNEMQELRQENKNIKNEFEEFKKTIYELLKK